MTKGELSSVHGEKPLAVYLAPGEEFLTNVPRRPTPIPMDRGGGIHWRTVDDSVKAYESSGDFESVRVINDAYDIHGNLLPDSVSIVGKRMASQDSPSI